MLILRSLFFVFLHKSLESLLFTVHPLFPPHTSPFALKYTEFTEYWPIVTEPGRTLYLNNWVLEAAPYVLELSKLMQYVPKFIICYIVIFFSKRKKSAQDRKSKS